MDPETQLEWFDVPRQTPRRPPIAPLGCLQIRQDHAVLVAIAGLISIAVVFALGVERGKRVVRTERLLLTPHGPVGAAKPSPAPSGHAQFSPGRTPRSSTTGGTRGNAEAPVTTPAPPATETTPQPQPAPSAPSKPLRGRSRFAIQVVTYRQPRLAQRELKRLQQQGERAFLVLKPGKTVLFVGPFPTKEHASARLASLKRQYQDCFLRSL